MERVVYADILFLINFSMDFLCLYISSKILSIKLSSIRAILSATLGGVYSVLALFLPSAYGLSFIVDVGVCLLMCLVAWGKARKKGDLFVGAAFYFAISMALGGVMTAIFNLLNRLGFDKLEATGKDGISVWLFALVAIISGGVTLLGGRFFKKRSLVRTAEVEISYGGKTKRISAIVDTGNLLCEPISGKPCVVADARELREILPSEVVTASARGGVSLLGAGEHLKNVRLVPARSATGERLLLALRVDKITIDTGKGAYEADALLALTSLDGRDALIPAGILR